MRSSTNSPASNFPVTSETGAEPRSDAPAPSRIRVTQPLHTMSTKSPTPSQPTHTAPQALGITPGEWYADEPSENGSIAIRNKPDTYMICRVNPTDDAELEDHHNARIIAEAGTVANQTGLSPRQLLAQRDELVEALKSISDSVEQMTGMVSDEPSPFLSSAGIAAFKANKQARSLLARIAAIASPVAPSAAQNGKGEA